MSEDTSQLGVRVIVAYKLTKAGAEIVLAALLTAVLIGGEEALAHDVAVALGRHVTGAWSLELTSLIARAAAPRRVELAIVALLLAGSLTSARDGPSTASSRGRHGSSWPRPARSSHSSSSSSPAGRERDESSSLPPMR